MSGFWRLWFVVWCLSIGVFGAVLSGGAFGSDERSGRSLADVFARPERDAL